MWTTVVWVASAAYAIGLSAESIYLHQRYVTGFDTAIFDQVLWLLAIGDEPFSTVASRPMLSGLQPGLAFLTPLYWLGLGVPGLLTAQSVGLALAAPALYTLARDLGATPPLAALPALLWLVSPWTSTVNLFEFHPEVFAPALLVVSVIAALRERWVFLGVTAVVAMSLKQDIPLTYLMLGLVLVIYGRRRVGAVLAAGSAVWLIATRILFESQGSSYDFYERRFAGDRGKTIREAFSWMLEHPGQTVTDVIGQSGVAVLLLLLATAGLALLAPRWLLLSVPTLLYNALSAYDPQHNLDSQYHLMAAAGLFIAAAVGVRRVGSLGGRGRVAVAGVGIAALAVVVIGVIATHDFSDRLSEGERAAIDRALDRIPEGASVAAAPNLLPHLSQRSDVYSLPEPFIRLDWGGSVTAEELAEAVPRVRFVAFAGRTKPSEYPGSMVEVYNTLLREGFVAIARTRAGEVVILERR